ncbi:UDP-Glycosyltransferase/glycogen phosphorylase [Pholiota conissans]|uniref:UDP-Glycosyltransferase/glycogen phosphorylase n=1 Tax=Pholiota conissans TaxID=109636 RepID=A0A9P6CST7_9AGAR|nr:UDP-Glycosyltransferase/glycogen phosphorylase [Pholiota conissans]
MSAGHIVVVSLPLWGHTRPLCVFTAKLQKASGSIVTFFVAELLLAKVKAEIARQYGEGEEEGLKRIRIISILNSKRDNADLPKVIAAYTTVYDAPYKALVVGESLVCTTGQVYDPAPFPSAVILDFLAPAQLQLTRLLTGTRVPIFAWVTGSAPVIIRYYCPENVGGLGDVAGRAKKNFEEAGEGAVLERFIEAEYGRFSGEVIHIPGMPPMFDYECFPQELPFSEPLFNTMEGKLFQTLNDSDGTVINTSEAYESVFIETLRSWLGDMGKAFFSVGPTLPVDFQRGELVKEKIDDNSSHIKVEHEAEQKEVAEFLESALQRYGKESVIFISFGSTYWPPDNSFVEEILNIMIEKDFPFIFAYGSPAAKLPEGLKSSPKGLLAKWVPQQYILNHPALGWFLTHCGQGSTTEALSSGVPMICYPFTSDQPFNAAYLSLTLDVAFELIQIRTGALGKKPLLRTGGQVAPLSTREAVREEIAKVVDEARGAVGRRKRANARRIQGLLRGAWEGEGLAVRDLKKFVDTYCKGDA